MKRFESEALKGASNEASREQGPFIDALVEQNRQARAFGVASALVARWEHGDETHRQWLRDIAIPDIARALLDWS